MSAAEVAARATAAAAVLADYKRELATAPAARPPGREWMLRLADVLDDLLYAMNRPGAAVAPGGSAVLQPPEVAVVLGALADAGHCGDIHRQLDGPTEADVATYRALSRSLGDDR